MRKILHIYQIITICMVVMLIASAFTKHNAQWGQGTIVIRFIHSANGKALQLNDSSYSNAFGETYSISKLKYYVSNISLSGNKPKKDGNNCFLIDVDAKQNDIQLSIPAGNYTSLHFLLGVDSLSNCSGAQSGALDPLHGMFWTWNSGYIMFKLEGWSPSSKADQNRIEQHIGGYRNGNNVAKQIVLPLDQPNGIRINANQTMIITIETNLDKYWKDSTDNTISETAVCASPGATAKRIATNFSGLFSIKNIVEQ